MAKQAAAPKARTFSFAPVVLDALPDLPTTTRAPSENELPFRREFFAKVPEMVTGPGQQVALFVPKAFWATREGVDFSKVDGSYQKSKLRDQFNKWQNETKKVTKERVREEPTKDKSGKIIKQGKVISEEESTNEQRGHYNFFAVERTGREPEEVWVKMGLTAKDAEEGVQIIVTWPSPKKS